jgi:regulator of replication initiation timing
VLVRENAQDRAIVKEMKETVSGVLIDLTEIQQHIAKSPFSPAALQIQRERLVNVLKNAGPILQVIQNSTEDTNSVNRAKSTEALLVLYYKQLSSWPKSNANPAKDIAQTAEMLGNVAIELKVLEGLLEQEKQLLTADVYRHFAKAITGRIRSTNLGQRDLNGMKNDLMKNAVDRRRNYGRILDSDSDSPGLQTAEQDSVILEQIRRGRLPENR